jgi:hypothetical protein
MKNALNVVAHRATLARMLVLWLGSIALAQDLISR